MQFPEEMIRRLPKTDLHCHLDGSLRIATIIDLARTQGIDLPAWTEEELRPHLSPEPSGGDLTEYLKIFDLTLSVLDTEEALARAAFELAEDAAKENVRYLEVRYSPILHQKRGLTLDQVVEAVNRGLAKACETFPIRCGVILCGIRQIDPEISLRLADLVVQYKGKGVVGFDLAGEEKDFPAKDHLEAFYRIRNSNVNITVHAGEAFGPPSIHQALHYAGTHRIGHGTRLREDRDLLQYVNDHRVGIEICLTSNVQTGAVTSLEEHPFRQYFQEGLRVTINTDNRLISATDSTKELQIAVQTFGLDLPGLRRLLINGVKSAFLPHQEKVKLMKEIISEMDEVFSEFCPDYQPYRSFL